MTEIDALKYDLEQKEKSFDKLHKMYISLLKQQGELEKENEQLRKDSTVLIYSNQDYMKENEQLKRELNTYKSGNALLKKTLDKELEE